MYDIAECYRNNHTKNISVRVSGKVVSRDVGAFILDAQYIVRESGRQKVLEEGRKNVHAFVRGNYITNWINPHHSLGPFALWNEWEMAEYNPYIYETFVDKSTKEPIFKSSLAVVTYSGVYYH